MYGVINDACNNYIRMRIIILNSRFLSFSNCPAIFLPSFSLPRKHRDFHVRSVAKGKRTLIATRFFFYDKLYLRNGNPFDADSEREMMASPARTGDFPATDDHPLHQITLRRLHVCVWCSYRKRD